MTKVQYAVIEETETKDSASLPDSTPRQVIRGVYDGLFKAYTEAKELHSRSSNHTYIQEVTPDSEGKKLKHIYLSDGVYKHSLYVYDDDTSYMDGRKVTPSDWIIASDNFESLNTPSINISLDGIKVEDYRYKDGVIHYEGEEDTKTNKNKVMKIDGLYVSRINSDYQYPEYPYINKTNTMESSSFNIGYTEFKNRAETFTDVQIEHYKKYLNIEVEDAPEK